MIEKITFIPKEVERTPRPVLSTFLNGAVYYDSTSSVSLKGAESAINTKPLDKETSVEENEKKRFSYERRTRNKKET